MLTAGLATFVTVGSALRDRDATVDVLVAAAPSAVGTASETLAVETVAIDADTVLLDRLVRSGALPVGLALGRPLAAGDVLLRSDFVESGSPTMVRTASLAIEPAVIDGLGLVVGDRVDVLGVDDLGATRFVVSGVRVARLPRAVGADGLLTGPGSSFVTVEVTAEEAVALDAARRLGPIDLVRSTGAPEVAVG